jgi:hypothetical protein
MLDGVVIDDARVLNTKLHEWEDYYNYRRPHGGPRRANERLRQKPAPGCSRPQPLAPEIPVRRRTR